MLSIYDSGDLGGKMLYRQVHLSWEEDPRWEQYFGLMSGHELSLSTLEAELRVHI